MKLTSCLKVIALSSVLSLVACFNYVELAPDHQLYWNDIEGAKQIPINIKDEGYKFRLEWYNDMAVSFRLSAKVRTSPTELENVTIPLVATMVGDSITCELDPSYVEIRCTSEGAGIDTGYIDITSIYSELPAEVSLFATWQWEEQESEVESFYNLILE